MIIRQWFTMIIAYAIRVPGGQGTKNPRNRSVPLQRSPLPSWGRDQKRVGTERLQTLESRCWCKRRSVLLNRSRAPHTTGAASRTNLGQTHRPGADDCPGPQAGGERSVLYLPFSQAAPGTALAGSSQYHTIPGYYPPAGRIDSFGDTQGAQAPSAFKHHGA
jgi:hypothetical protein